MDLKAGMLAIPSKLQKGVSILQIGNPLNTSGLEKPGIPFSEIWKVYEQVPWVRAVVDSLSKDASKVQFNIVEKEGAGIGSGTQIDTLTDFFEDPSEGEETFGDIIAMAVNDCLLHDGHGLEIVTARDRTPTELINVSATTLKPYYDKKRRRVTGWYHEIPETNIKVFFKVGKTYPSSNYSLGYNVTASDHPFTYIRINPWAHRLGYGYSPVETLTNELAMEIAQGKANAEFFLNRSRPDGYVKGLPDRESAREFLQYWKQNYKGPENAGNTVVLYGEGVEYQEYTEQRKEWDIELRKWTLKTICAVYGINDAELGGEKTENRATAEQRHEIAKNRCLAFLLSRLQQRMNKLIIPLFFEDPLVQFRFESIDNQDLNLLVQIYSALLDRGVVTINEVRNRLNLGESVDWGDQPFDLRSLILSGMWPGSVPGTEKSAGGFLKKSMEITEDEARDIKKKPYNQLAKEGEKELIRIFNIVFSRAISEIKEEIKRMRKSAMLEEVLKNILMIAFDTSTKTLKEQAMRTFFKGYLAQKYALPPISFDLAAQEAISFIRSYTTPFMLRFCEETRRDILDVVMHGISEDSSVVNIVRELETVIDSDKSYLQMVARTESKRAFNFGALERYKRHTNQVRVLDGDGCEECIEANGQIWTIEEAMANPLQHPNCLRDFEPHFEEETS